MATVPPLVELRKVWKTFDRKPVLRGIDLALAKGTILAVMGGSGTGKTVMLRIASGLIYPDSGAVSLFGVRIDRMALRPEEVSVKAKSPEHLGLLGREEGIAAMARNSDLALDACKAFSCA